MLKATVHQLKWFLMMIKKKSNYNSHQKQVQNTIGHAFRTITVSQPQFSYFYRKVQTPFTISPEKQ